MKEFSCLQLSCLGPGTLWSPAASIALLHIAVFIIHVMAEKLGRVQWDPRMLPDHSPTSRQVS